MQSIAQLRDMFTVTKENIVYFMNLISPIIANAADEHQRMYFHHIFEEEEQHLERLEQFLPKLTAMAAASPGEDSERKLIGLLQDINLETFGQHNFLEHLELMLFHFTSGETNRKLHEMIDQTKHDYLIIKDILFRLNEEFLPEANRSKASDHHDVHSSAHAEPASSDFTWKKEAPARKGLTVGSLRGMKK